MIKINGVALFAATALLVGGQALATPVNVSGANGEDTLQDVFDNITVGGPSSIDVNADQLSQSGYWSIGASGGSFTQMIIEIAGYADQNAFGIFDAADPGNRFQLFSGAQQANSSGSAVTFGFTVGNEVYLGDPFNPTSTVFSDSLFGFYLDSPDGLFFSAPDLNPDGAAHMVAFQGNGVDELQVGNTAAGTFQTNEYIFGWEDLLADNWDYDYNDFVVLAESVQPETVPEPSELGLALLGLSLIGLGVTTRRSSSRNQRSSTA